MEYFIRFDKNTRDMLDSIIARCLFCRLQKFIKYYGNIFDKNIIIYLLCFTDNLAHKTAVVVK